jgi:hypothetical protein
MRAWRIRVVRVFHPRRWAAMMATEEVRRRLARDTATSSIVDRLNVSASLADLPLDGYPLLNDFAPRCHPRH